MSQFPSSTFVDSALLTLNLTSVSGAPFPIQVDFCRIAESWDSRAVTYETVDDPAFISGSCVSGSLPETLTPDTYEMVVEITDIFKEWLSGSPNYGIRIKANANNYGVEGYATEAGSGGPTLTVTYGWIP